MQAALLTPAHLRLCVVHTKFQFLSASNWRKELSRPCKLSTLTFTLVAFIVPGRGSLPVPFSGVLVHNLVGDDELRFFQVGRRLRRSQPVRSQPPLPHEYTAVGAIEGVVAAIMHYIAQFWPTPGSGGSVGSSVHRDDVRTR